MGAPGAWTVYNDAKANSWKGRFNLLADTFKVALFTAASIAINDQVTPATYAAFASDGHEVASGGGYTTAGAAAPSPSLTGGGASGTIIFSTANASWTASGGGFAARAAVIYDVTTGYAIAYMLLDATPADVAISPPQILSLQVSNVFNETGN